MKNRKYSFLKAIPLSFFSASLYRDVARNWRWTTFFYLCFVVAVCAIPATMNAQRLFRNMATHFVNSYVVQAPTILVTNGIARTPEKKPYLIYDPDTKEVVAMIDTTGAHKNLENEKFDFLITSNSLIIKDRDVDKTTVTVFPESLTGTFDPAVVKDKTLTWLKWSWVFLYPLIFFVSVIYRFLLSMLYGAFGKVLASFSEIELTYEEIVRMSMVAMTPVLLIHAVMSVFHLWFPMQGFVLLMVGLGYVFFAVRVNEVD